MNTTAKVSRLIPYHVIFHHVIFHHLVSGAAVEYLVKNACSVDRRRKPADLQKGIFWLSAVC
jgi:hypothetical protein